MCWAADALLTTLLLSPPTACSLATYGQPGFFAVYGRCSYTRDMCNKTAHSTHVHTSYTDISPNHLHTYTAPLR